MVIEVYDQFRFRILGNKVINCTPQPVSSGPVELIIQDHPLNHPDQRYPAIGVMDKTTRHFISMGMLILLVIKLLVFQMDIACIQFFCLSSCNRLSSTLVGMCVVVKPISASIFGLSMVGKPSENALVRICSKLASSAIGWASSL